VAGSFGEQVQFKDSNEPMNIRSKPKNADAGNEYASLQDYLI
jgi:hypothetical protein